MPKTPWEWPVPTAKIITTDNPILTAGFKYIDIALHRAMTDESIDWSMFFEIIIEHISTYSSIAINTVKLPNKLLKYV